MGEKEELPGGVRGGAARRWLHALVRPPAGAELSTARVASYGVGGFTFVILGDIPGFFLNPFLLEVAYMEPVAAGNMLLVAKVECCRKTTVAAGISRQPLGQQGLSRPRAATPSHWQAMSHSANDHDRQRDLWLLERECLRPLCPRLYRASGPNGRVGTKLRSCLLPDSDDQAVLTQLPMIH